MSDEIEIEPVPGLPHALPAGERILWQGRPSWRGLARDAFHLRGLSLYFGVFVASRGVVALQAGDGFTAAVLSSLKMVPLAALSLGLLALLAALNARATVYTLTSRRVVMRFGIAFPMTFNLPFKRIGAAHSKPGPGGSGDIALQLSGPGRLAYLHLWPHARPWQFKQAQPMLRAIPELAKVSALLADAVQAWSAESSALVVVSPAPDTGTTAPSPTPVLTEAHP